MTPYNVAYDGVAHTASATVTGVDAGGAALGTTLTLSGTTHSHAGTFNGEAWSFSGGVNYYDANGTVNDNITPYAFNFGIGNDSHLLGYHRRFRGRPGNDTQRGDQRGDAWHRL